MDRLFLKEDLTKRHRLVNWWVRWEDLKWPNHDGYENIKRRAQALAKANVTAAIIFGAHFRWDYLPYFTILHDYIATVAQELHKYGIELYDRHSVNLVHRYDTPEEMRHVILHSGPHLPFSPSREAAASWEYQGKKLNDWRMIDVRDQSVLYYPQYAAEGFCYRNPEFVEAYCNYAKNLIATTGIDGLAAEDPVHYMHYISCACPHCRAELKKRAGIDLPPIEDKNFWGNWENPAWQNWIDLRYDAGKEFFLKLQAELPANFRITTCGANSAAPGANGAASDARTFIEGSNYVHLEMSGNTPPYKNDPVTCNVPISGWITGFSHHQAVAREKQVRAFSTGYGFTVPSANIIWAVNKLLDLDCCFSTLKDRLGLPDHMLKDLPTEADVVAQAYGFEQANPDLFNATQVAQVGVYFSYETQRHTCYGNIGKGYYQDYSLTLRLLLKAGISAHTIFSFSAESNKYSVVILSGVAAMTATEKAELQNYLKQGGKVIVVGPSALENCKTDYVLPTHPQIKEPNSFFSTIANGVWHKAAEWIGNTEIPVSGLPNVWTQPQEGILFNPHRINDSAVGEKVVDFCRQYTKQLPVTVIEAQGYFITIFENEKNWILHFLAAEYDTEIDRQLDEMRFHRSRVNYINKVIPTGVSNQLKIQTKQTPIVYLPFNPQTSTVEQKGDICTITLPPNTAYGILEIKKSTV